MPLFDGSGTSLCKRRAGTTEHIIPVRTDGTNAEGIDCEPHHLVDTHTPRGEVGSGQVAAKRPSARPEMEVGTNDVATAFRMPVIGSDLAALRIIQGVQIAGRVDTPLSAPAAI